MHLAPNKSTMAAKRFSVQPNWSCLPKELLQLILTKLGFGLADIVRFKAVSSSWCMAVNAYVSSPTYSLISQTPWLMLPKPQGPSNTNSSSTLTFFSIAEKKVYVIKNDDELFEPIRRQEAWCIGSSHGWFIFLYKTQAKLALVNPLSEVIIALPSVRPLMEFYQEDDAIDISLCNQSRAIYKAVLLSNPSLSESFVVVVLYDIYPRKLAFYVHENHGDDNNNSNTTTWTKFGDRSYNDVIFVYGKLYALIGNTVEVWDFCSSSKSFPEKVSVIVAPYVSADSVLDENMGADGYKFQFTAYHNCLVESLGQVLYVVWISVTIPGKSHKLFKVYRLNCCEKRWEKLETLWGQALFLGSDQSTSVSARDIPACERNSIYVAAAAVAHDHTALNSIFYTFRPYPHLEPYKLVYNLEENVVKHFHHQPNNANHDDDRFWIVS